MILRASAKGTCSSCLALQMSGSWQISASLASAGKITTHIVPNDLLVVFTSVVRDSVDLSPQVKMVFFG